MRETGHSSDRVRTMEDDGGVDGVESSHLLGCCAVGHASGEFHDGSSGRAVINGCVAY